MNAGERQAALESARGGDAQALGRLLESYRPYVRVIVRSFRDNRLQARVGSSDMIQDALLEAHRAFASFRGVTVAELTAWLRQIVVRTAGHVAREHAGAAKRDLDREEPGGAVNGQLADPGSSPSEQAIRHEQAALLADAMAQLPEDMQQVLLGRHMDGLSYTTLAEQLGRSEAAVRVLYTRALRRLRQHCQD
jgi:RNA polymerase sigma-70 factor (ECF subfamily)